MGIYLLEERKKDESVVQPLRPFLETLPKNLSDFPLYFTKKELSFLKGSPINEQIQS